MATNWLNDLARQSLGDFEATDHLDRELSTLALKAKSDKNASWQLFGMLAWKVERFVQRFRFWDLGPFDLDDVAQESYLVYLDTVQRWQPRYVDGEASGYLYYFLKTFPYWLANAVRRWRRPARASIIRAVRHKSNEATCDAGVVINDFCRNLGPKDATLLRLRVTSGLSMRGAAATMGIPCRTAHRRWHRIRELGREYLRKAS